MAYSTIAVANAFIERAKGAKITDLTPMKLQKLVFFAQSWSLKILDKPLVEDFFAKWTYGPVQPQLYHAVKDYQNHHISTLISTLEFTEDGGFQTVTPEFVDEVGDFRCIIDNIITVYGHMTAANLSRLTHLPDSAWAKAGDEQAVLDNKLLKECIVIEEGRFMSQAEFPFNFELDRMQKMVSGDFVTVPDGLETLDDFDDWLRKVSQS